MVLPDMSMTRASEGMSTLPLGPMAAIRLSRITTSPRSMTSSPRMVMRRAPVRARRPSGRSFATTISTSTRFAW